MNNIKFSIQACNLIELFEGFSSQPYPDPASGGEPITTAFGSTHYCDGRKVTLLDPPVTKEVGKEMVLCFLNTHVLPDLQKHITVTLNQNQIDSIGSLVYNIGDLNFDKSTLLKKIDSNILGNSLKDFWLTWDHAGGRVIGGLLIRRTKEFNYFETGKI